MLHYLTLIEPYLLKKSLKKEIFQYHRRKPFDKEEDNYSESGNDQNKRINLKMKAIFQNLYYQVVHGLRIRLYIYYMSMQFMNTVKVVSYNLITTFSRQYCSVSFKKIRYTKIHHFKEQRAF